MNIKHQFDAMTVQERNAYEEAINCGACHDDALDAAHCAQSPSNYWVHRGVRIVFAQAFNQETMVYQWSMKNKSLKQLVVMQHVFLTEAIDAINEHLDSTNVSLPFQS